VSESQIRKWKNQDSWNGNVTKSGKGNVTKRKQGAQPGNKNAVGNGAQPGNKNAEKHGFYCKYLPEDTVEIMEEMPRDPLDVLWDQIQIAYAAIIRAQHIMYVEDKEDSTKAIIGDGEMSTSYDVQYAWDKQEKFLAAQARAQKTLESMVGKYDEMLRKRSDEASEEQRLRLEKLKAETERIKGADQNPKEERIEALMNRIGEELDGS